VAPAKPAKPLTRAALDAAAAKNGGAPAPLLFLKNPVKGKAHRCWRFETRENADAFVAASTEVHASVEVVEEPES
jgi:hypothetical protein